MLPMWPSLVKGKHHGSLWVKDNVWFVIHEENLIGSVFLPTNLTGSAYLAMLQEQRIQYLESLPLLRLWNVLS